MLWPDEPPAAADTALSALLSKLRRALGEGALSGRSELQLAPDVAVRVDVEEAAALARQAEAALHDGEWTGAAATAHAALAACAGDFLPDCDGPWPLGQRRALDGLRVRAYEVLADASLRSGEPAEAADAARAAASLAPFRESAHRLLMEAHEAAGNPAEALRAFEDLRRLLREELGTAPGPAAMALHERLLHGRAPRSTARAARPPPSRRGAGRRRSARRSTGTRSWAARPRRRGSMTRGAAAAAGRRSIVALAGEAGIGKTRLAAELAGHAHADGAVVLYGRFEEDALAPYRPVVQMLRGWAGGASLAPLAGAARPARGGAGDRAARVRGAVPVGRRLAARARRRHASACASSTRWPPCSPRSPAPHRSSSCWTTCTGPTSRRSS